MDVGDAESNNDDNTYSKDTLIFLDISERLQQEQILTAFVVSSKTGFIAASLNHVYDKKILFLAYIKIGSKP